MPAHADDAARLPISLIADGVPWRAPEAAEDGPRRTWTAPGGALRAACLRRELPGGAVRWDAELSNPGEVPGPLVEAVAGFDQTFGDGAGGATLVWSTGDNGGADALIWHESPLAPGQARAFTGGGGFSSSDTLPYFCILMPEDSAAIAVAACGPWRAVFTRGADGRVRVQAGPAFARFRPAPGERLALPAVIVAEAGGWDAPNRLRAALRPEGCDAAAPVAAALDGARVDAAGCLAAMDAAARAGCEAALLGAGWADRSGGDRAPLCEPDAKRFPQGLRPLSDAARRLGLAFGLWMEPERVGPESAIRAEHPEFLLEAPGRADALLDLGNAAARAWITDWIDARVKAWGVDILRHAATLDPAGYWAAHEAEDRVGVAALRHSAGLDALWSELRSRNPGLRIDASGAGGQRLDAASLAHGPALCRARKNAPAGGDAPDAAAVPRLARAAQVGVAGLSRYVAAHGGPAWGVSPYAFRSAAALGVTLCDDLLREGFPHKALAQAIAELKSLRPYWLGDYHPLCQLLLNQRAWFGFQLHRPDLDAGFAMLFRRPDSPYPACEVDLHAIAPEGRYLVSTTDESFTEAPRLKCTGRQLLRLDLRINTRPGSKLLRYRRLPDPTRP